jgi:hypothetical protein
MLAAHLPVYVEPRYGLPIVPFLAVFAAHGINQLIHSTQQRLRFSGVASTVSPAASSVHASSR